MLLCGGLLLVLAQGVFQLPEVESRLFPQRFWTSQIHRVQSNLIITEMHLAEAEATLEVLDRGAKVAGAGVSGPPPKNFRAWGPVWQRVEGRCQKYREEKLQLEGMLQRYQRLYKKTLRPKAGS